MPLRNNAVSMRDLNNAETSPFARYVDSLDENEKGNLNPGDPTHAGMINQIVSAIQTGQLDETRVAKIARRNPNAAPVFFSALGEQQRLNQNRATYSKYFSPAQEGMTPLTPRDDEGNVNTVIPPTPAKADMQGAVTELLSKGDVAGAKGLLELQGTQNKDTPFAKINPKDFTQSSVAKFEKTNRFSDLVPTDDVKGDSAKAFDHASKLRSEFNALSKPFMEVRDSFGRIEESAKNPSAAGDLALIFNYMKMLDPGSTVREGEFATAQNSGGIPDRVRAMYNNVLNGERLSTPIRNDFTSRAKGLFERQKQTHQKLETQYRSLAKLVGVDEKQVVTDFGYEPLKETETPKPSPAAGWTPDKEKRYQELLRKRNAQ